MIACIGQSVYFPSSASVWDHGIVVDDSGSDLTITTEEQKLRTFPRSSILPKEENAPEAMHNICAMNHLHEASILFHLERRFEMSCVYTFANNICIAVNPYKRVSCPDSATRQQYCPPASPSLSPHVFSVSARAVALMRESGASQSVIVSGESGAGKTETVKLLLTHVAELSTGGKSGRDGSAIQVMEGATVLESFGNASTAQNDNSSRFGKFLTLRFDGSLRMLESGCTTYLLEKCRVVRQGSAAAERNFHIFYELLSAPDDVRTRLGLHEAGAEDFHFTQRRALSPTQSKEYALRFADTDRLLRCRLKVVADSGTGTGPVCEVRDVYAVLAGLLYIGELQGKAVGVKPDCGKAAPCAPARAAQLLGVTEDSLEATLAHRRVVVGDSCIHVPLSDAETCRARDALAKDIYVRVFDWLVRTVNSTRRDSATAADPAHVPMQRSIALLDIFGFEVFEENRFEQLCINYANEALQRLFAHEVIQAVQCEYAQEGVPWTEVAFQDNSDVLELIEGKLGVFHLLNEECVVPGGADASFVSKLCATQRASSVLQPERTRPRCFTIRHYAGCVTYDSDGFLDKNRDTLLPHAAALMSQSRSPFLAELFRVSDANEADSKPRSVKRNASTVAFKFRAHLNALVAHLQSTKVHFVRCFKPNCNKRPDEFDRRLVVQQLRSAGVVAAASVSQSAYPGKLPKAECARLTRLLLPFPAAHRCLDDSASLQLVLRDELHIAAQVGATKVYFAPGQLEALVEKVGVLKLRSVVRVQAWVRACRCRESFRTLRRAVVLVQSVARRAWHCLRYRKFCAAAVLVQVAWRRKARRRQQHRIAAAALVLQAWTRGRLAAVRRKADLSVAAGAVEVEVTNNEQRVLIIDRSAMVDRCTQTCCSPHRPRGDQDWERVVEEFEELRRWVCESCCPHRILGSVLLQLPMLVVSAAVIAVLAQ